jgi:hypothetical protein
MDVNTDSKYCLLEVSVDKCMNNGNKNDGKYRLRERSFILRSISTASRMKIIHVTLKNAVLVKAQLDGAWIGSARFTS